MPGEIVSGCRIAWPAGKQKGYVESAVNGKAVVVFDDGTTRTFALAARAIEPDPFKVGSLVMRSDQVVGVVIEVVPGPGAPTWKVAFASGKTLNVAEWVLRPALIDDPIERFKTGMIDSAEQFNLRSVAADMWTRHLHDELVSLSHARVDLKPHQVSVVHRVVSNYPHRFLLCDEVGLGKTIEAAMIIKELRVRRIARRVLILVPPGLARQWQFELKTKFNETFAIYDGSTVAHLANQGILNPWTANDSIITSTTWASWSPERRAQIAAVDWDLVVVDEAHHARRQRNGTRIVQTNLYRLVSDLTARPECSRRAVLFLTATPMQLQRHELYSLVDLLNPTLFSSEEDFEEHLNARVGLSQLVEAVERDRIPTGVELDEFLDRTAAFLGCSPTAARTLLAERGELAERLRQCHRLSEVLLRNRRAVVGGFQPRHAYRWEVDRSADEVAIQAKVDAILVEGYEAARLAQRNATGFLMVVWQKLAASSSRALLRSFRARAARLITTQAVEALQPIDAEEALSNDASASDVSRRIGPAIGPALEDELRKLKEVIQLLEPLDTDSKAKVLVLKLRELLDDEPDAKVVLFTEFRETQDFLADLLTGDGWGCNLFHGQLGVTEKDEAVRRFQMGTGPQVLVSTEAGGEGRNFQFAHVLVNYDLPWNPMRVEQRIGRIDRIGQQHPVTIFNFHVRGTIEGRILDVLERRIQLFEASVGGLDPILGDAELEIRKALQNPPGKREVALDDIGRKLEEDVRAARKASDQLRDLVLDTRSFSAQIAQTIQQQQASISQSEFELLLVKLLRSVNTYVEAQPNSAEHLVHFHPPFTEEHRDLVGTTEKRRVCFDPRVAPDSEHIEYFGFGHPIVDALVSGVVEERPDGSAAIRRIAESRLPGVQPGWQFNWLLKVAGLETREVVVSVFVDEAGVADLGFGDQLLRLSREFERETFDEIADTSTLEQSYQAGRDAFVRYRDELVEAFHSRAADRYDVERSRIERLFEHRRSAARDRLSSCQRTLGRLSESGDALQRQVIPIWEGNVLRAESELNALDEDRERMLRELDRSRVPQVEDRFLGVARIEPAPPPAIAPTLA